MKSTFNSEKEANDYKAEHQLHGRVAEPITGTGKWALNFPLDANVTVKQPHVNTGEVFQPGEVWKSPKGSFHLVIGYEEKTGKPKQAVLKLGITGFGRKKLRDWDAVNGWSIYPTSANT